MINAATKDEDQYGEIGKQAIEFWSACGETEEGLLMDNEPIFKFVEKAAASFMSLYLTCLGLQHFGDDDDSQEWTMRTAAGCSLEIIARLIKDKIIENNAVTQFIGQVLQALQTKQNQNVWAYQEALITFIGSVAEGPSKEGFTNFMTKALDGNSANNKKNCLLTFVASHLPRTQQTNKHVQRSACWAFAKICASCPECIVSVFATQQVATEMGKLIQNGTAKQTDHANWALTSMIEFWYHSEKRDKRYYMNDDLIRNLIGVILDRITKDSSGRVIVGCFESLNAIVGCLAPSQGQIAMSLLNEILSRMQNIVMHMQNKNSNEDATTATVRSFQLTGCFSTVTAVVGLLAGQYRDENPNKTDDPVPFLEPKHIELVITAFTVANKPQNNNNNNNNNNNSNNNSNNNNNNNNNDGESRGVAQTEEALHAISVLAAACNNNFYQYLATEFVQDTLLATLNNDVEANPNLCRVAAASISELFLRCSQKIQNNQNQQQSQQIIKFGDKVALAILAHINNATIVLEIKSDLFDALTTICESFGRKSDRYWPNIISKCCAFACQDTTGMDMTDEDLVGDVNAIRREMLNMLDTAQVSYNTDMRMSKLKFVVQYEKFIHSLLQAVVKFDTYNDGDVLSMAYEFLEHCIADDDEIEAQENNNYQNTNNNLSQQEQMQREQLKDKFRHPLIQSLLQLSTKIQDKKQPELKKKAECLFRVKYCICCLFCTLCM